jgi:hypothetical protein
MIYSAQEFAVLCESEVLVDRQRARDEIAAIETWKDIVARYPELHACVVLNRTISPEILHLVAQSPDDRARLILARRRRLLRETFEVLAQDNDENIRAALVGNPKLPPDLAKILTNDPSEWVRSAFSRNRFKGTNRLGGK